MNYYKDAQGNVFAYSDIQSADPSYVQMTAEEIDAHLNQPPTSLTADDARAQRDRLLAQSDWTQLPDVANTISAAWAPYRQALRDVPSQKDFPTTITWPTAPEAV